MSDDKVERELKNDEILIETNETNIRKQSQHSQQLNIQEKGIY